MEKYKLYLYMKTVADGNSWFKYEVMTPRIPIAGDFIPVTDSIEPQPKPGIFRLERPFVATPDRGMYVVERVEQKPVRKGKSLETEVSVFCKPLEK